LITLSPVHSQDSFSTNQKSQFLWRNWQTFTIITSSSTLNYLLKHSYLLIAWIYKFLYVCWFVQISLIIFFRAIPPIKRHERRVLQYSECRTKGALPLISKKWLPRNGQISILIRIWCKWYSLQLVIRFCCFCN